MRAIGILFAGLVVTACAGKGGGAGDPREVVTRWSQAVERDDPRAAYELLSAEQRKQMRYEEFETRWKASQAERKRMSALLVASADDASRLDERALVKLPDGKAATLVRENGGWHLEVPLVASLRALTPQAALRYFAAALRDRNPDALARVLSREGRKNFQELLDELAAGVEEHIGGEVEVSRNRAQLRWKTAKGAWRITLVREEGEWRVHDLVIPMHPQPVEPPP